MQDKGIDILALLNVPTEYRSVIRVELTLEDLILFTEHMFKVWQQKNSVPQEKPDIGGMEIAMEETGLKKSTIYSKVCKNKLPHFKQGGKLYFSRKILRAWISKERVLTADEIEAKAFDYMK